MAINPGNITQHELIGLDAEVSEATNKSLKGLKGKITDETQNTITITNKDKTRKILKSQVKITVIINNQTVEIDGKVLVGRPEERIKK